MHFLIPIALVWLLVRAGYGRWLLYGGGALLVLLIVWDGLVNEMPLQQHQEQERQAYLEWCKKPYTTPNTIGPFLDDYMRSGCPGAPPYHGGR